MKNKESYKRTKSAKSYQSKNSVYSKIENKSTPENNSKIDRSTLKNTPIYTKSQIERLKKFYYTTKWLPNSAFTTYFGKPAFENYGYGNTKPVYGGLFYGNYMLSHNINPIDGGNTPDSKQVYSSAMLKALKRSDIRKPEPPRKTPEEIRNTKEELEELKTRNLIFQLPNGFPRRDIIKPDLLKATYFKSGKNTPRKASEDHISEKFPEFNIVDVMNNKKLKMTKINSKIADTDFNPYTQGKVKLEKKKLKEDLDFKRKKNKSLSSSIGMADEERENYNKESHDYIKQKEFYEKMLKDEDESKKLYYKESKESINSNHPETHIKNEENKNEIEIFNKINNQSEECPKCHKNSEKDKKIKSRKKENPCLLAPDQLEHQPHLCCLHGYEEKIKIPFMNPKNFRDQPACELNKIIPAGKPVKKSITVAELLK